MTDRHEQIALRAYRIWEEAGRPEGQDRDHWTAAEAEFRPDAEPGAEAESEPEVGDGGVANDGDASPLPAVPADESVPEPVVRRRAGGKRSA
jgi:hypothetical protein